MSGTYLHFPKSYRVDDYYFSLIACLVRHEFKRNSHLYSPDRGLKFFVHRVEKNGWDQSAEGAIDMAAFCGGKETNREFLKCLGNVRRLLLTFDGSFPAEIDKLLPVGEDPKPFHQMSVKRTRYWLDQLSSLVENYGTFSDITIIPSPKDS
jgi:hypothetical protein